MDVTLVGLGYQWTGERVARVRPQDLDAPTPCTRWDVRALLNHMIGAVGFMAEVAAGESSAPDAHSWARTDLIGSDPAAAFTNAAERALAAWRAPGAMDRQCVLPFGTEPGWRVAQRGLTDAVVHGWDLSRAIGENADIPDELADPLWEIDQVLMDDSLRGGPFAAPVSFTGGTTSDRLVAFLGRQP